MYFFKPKLSMKVIQKTIDAYLKYQKTNKDKYFWAWIEFDNIARSSPEGLDSVVALINACQTDQEISYVAAGPLEDLIKNFPLQLKEKLNLLVRQNPKMRKAIQGVWATKGSTSRLVLDDILKENNLIYSSL